MNGGFDNTVNINLIQGLMDLFDGVEDGFSRLDSMLGISQSRLETVQEHLKLEQAFGFTFDKKSHPTWLQVGRPYCELMKLGLFGKHTGRSVSWSDDGSQPSEHTTEWLLVVKFPTGAFIFGEHYPKKTFDSFFAELKAYSPKYCDSNNHALYFSSDNAKLVVDNIYDIKAKYFEQSSAEKLEKKRQDLLNQLAALDK